MSAQEVFALPLGEVLPFPAEWTFIGGWLREGLEHREYDAMDRATENRRRAAFDAALARGEIETASIWNFDGGPPELFREYPMKRVRRAKAVGCYAVFRIRPPTETTP